MKTVFVFLLSLCLYGVTYAQVNFKVEKVSADDVPANVVATQSANFSAVVRSWEKQTASARSKAGTRYVASFIEQAKTVTRARYTSEGKGLTATTYYRAGQLPAAIQEAAAANYTGYTLISGEKVLAISTKQNFFRLRLRKGPQKLVVYVDNNGKELEKNEVPEEVVEDENVSN